MSATKPAGRPCATGSQHPCGAIQLRRSLPAVRGCHGGSAARGATCPGAPHQTVDPLCAAEGPLAGHGAPRRDHRARGLRRRGRSRRQGSGSGCAAYAPGRTRDIGGEGVEPPGRRRDAWPGSDGTAGADPGERRTECDQPARKGSGSISRPPLVRGRQRWGTAAGKALRGGCGKPGRRQSHAGRSRLRTERGGPTRSRRMRGTRCLVLPWMTAGPAATRSFCTCRNSCPT